MHAAERRFMVGNPALCCAYAAVVASKQRFSHGGFACAETADDAKRVEVRIHAKNSRVAQPAPSPTCSRGGLGWGEAFNAAASACDPSPTLPCKQGREPVGWRW